MRAYKVTVENAAWRCTKEIKASNFRVAAMRMGELLLEIEKAGKEKDKMGEPKRATITWVRTN